MRLLLYLLVMAGTASGVFWKTAAAFHEDDALPWVPLSAPVPGGGDWHLSGVAGTVFRLSPDGEWVAASDGDKLQSGQQLRTSEAGRVSIKGPGEAQLAMGNNGLVVATQLSESGAVFQCQDGLVAVNPKGTPVVIRLRAQKGEVSSKGRVNVLCGPDRDLVLAGEDGVTVKVGDASLALNKLEVARIEPRNAPVKEKVDDALQLLPSPPRRENGALVVMGVASRSARVYVGDTAATTDAQGRFAVLVPARDAASATTVHALDVAGRQKSVPLPAATAVPAARPGARGRPRGR